MVDPGQYSPDPAKLAGSLSNCRLAGIKMSPLLKDDYLKALAPEIEFVSYGRECREVVAWMGSECIPGWRARHLESNSTLEQVDRLFTTAEPGKFLYDADPAAVRAHALKNFGLRQLGDSLGYLTGDDDLDSPWLSKYAVQYAGKGDVKSTKEACKRLGLSVFEVKKRNAEVDTDKLLRELSKVEGAPCSLVVFSVGKSVRHLLVN